MFERLRPHVPEHLSGMSLVGIHVPLRIYRYETGQQFGVHQDQSYFADEDTRSLLTIMIYLNGDCEGGESEFVDFDRPVAPRTRTALLPHHMLTHAGREPASGAQSVPPPHA